MSWLPSWSRRATRSSASTPTSTGAPPSDRWHESIRTIEKDVRAVEARRPRGASTPSSHLAALSNDPLGDLNPQLTYDINHLASVRLAALARSRRSRPLRVRVVVQQLRRRGRRAGERGVGAEPGHRRTASRRCGPSATSASWPTLRSPPTFLRCATAYGVSPRLRFDVVLNNLVAWAFTAGKVLLKSDGTPWRPIVHIEDIARAFLAVLAAPREAVHAQALQRRAATTRTTASARSPRS